MTTMGADAQSYNSDLDAFEQYHQHKELDNSPPFLPAFGHGLAGAIGGAAANVAIYPLNLMITRAQTAQKKATTDGEKESILQITRNILESNGISGLYAGCAIDTAKTMADSFLFFMAYNAVRQRRLQVHGGRRNLPVIDELSVGFVAGIFSKFFTAPLSNVVTRLQTSTDKSIGVASIIEDIRREKGYRGLWAGFSANFVTTLNPSLTFFLFEFLKKATLSKEDRAKPSVFVIFLLSAISKSLASTATYPFSLAKARAQTRKDEPKEFEKAPDSIDFTIHRAQVAAKNSIFGIIAQIVQDEGIGALYQGVELEVTKGFLSHGLTMVIKESVHKVILQLYWTLLRITNRYPSPKQMLRSMTRFPDAGSANEFATSMFDEVKDRSEAALEGAADASRSAVDGMGEWMEDYIGEKDGNKGRKVEN